jgi:hypothetical protein
MNTTNCINDADEYNEILKKRQLHIQSSKNTIDEFIKNNDFQNAFTKLIVLLISVESKEIPYILKYYDDLMKFK